MRVHYLLHRILEAVERMDNRTVVIQHRGNLIMANAIAMRAALEKLRSIVIQENLQVAAELKRLADAMTAHMEDHGDEASSADLQGFIDTVNEISEHVEGIVPGSGLPQVDPSIPGEPVDPVLGDKAVDPRNGEPLTQKTDSDNGVVYWVNPKTNAAWTRDSFGDMVSYDPMDDGAAVDQFHPTTGAKLVRKVEADGKVYWSNDSQPVQNWMLNEEGHLVEYTPGVGQVDPIVDPIVTPVPEPVFDADGNAVDQKQAFDADGHLNRRQ